MLARIAVFELRYQLRSSLFLFVFALFFLLAFGSVASEHIQIGSTANVHVNSPYAILQTLAVMSVFSLFIVAAFVASAVIRDQETGFAPILYSTRLRKPAYLIGRFLGATVVALLLLAAVPLGSMIGTAMPWLDQEKVGPFVLTYYLYALFVFALPVLLVAGAGLFALATATRSMMWTYVGLLAFLVLYFTVQILFRDPAYDHLTALLDPFGIGALDITTKYWTAAERNTRLPALAGVLLENRLLWLSLAAVLFAVAYVLFRFEAHGARVDGRRSRGQEEPAAPVVSSPAGVRPVAVPGKGAWAAFLVVMRFEMRSLFLSPGFVILLVLGVLNSLGGLSGIVSDRMTDYFPVTRAVVSALGGSFTLFALIIVIYYSGELVWRDRERRIHEIVDACPVPSWAVVLPKIVAISLVLLATLLAAALTGIGFQLAHGYTHLELPHYLLWLVLPTTITLVQLAVLGVVVQSVVPHMAVGWGVMIIYLVLTATLSSLGFENGLYQYAHAGEVPLSDMNGMGRFWIGRAWFELYWSAFAAMLVVLSLLLWRRGAEARFLPRVRLAWRQLRGGPAVALAAAALVFVGSGAYIYYNIVILNDYGAHTDIANERYYARYERTLLQYESVPQPKVLSMKLAVQLHPVQVRADTVGSYVIENRTQAPIPTLHVRWDRRMQLLQLDVGAASVVQDFKDLNYRIYRLATPLAPGERRTLTFSTRVEERGFPNSRPLTRIVENGTFLNNFEISPLIGMARESLIQDRAKRRRNGLPVDTVRPAKLESTAADAVNYIRHDSDWVDAEISVTTDADQTPLAPGYTVSDKVSNGRRTLVTRTEAPILPFFSIQSARYKVAHDLWKGGDGHQVDLAVYYHPAHPYNIQKILAAMKTSLDIYSERFSPYQFRQARILEFPTYERFAQSFANTIPFSEGIGFIQNYDPRTSDDNSIDLVTFVTAHELGHQWWAHQVIGADKQGDTMLSESFAQYSAMLVMEKVYGREHVRKFLKDYLDDYLRSRGSEAVEELPLERVEDQPYIHYAKGIGVMYWLKEALGEEVVNRSLRRLLAAHAFKGPPYPSSTDFLTFLREEAGPGHEQMIEDLFARITVYDMKARDAVAHRLADGRYEVRFTVAGTKYYANGQGKETEAPLEEPFDVGAFTVEPGRKGYQSDSIVKIERLTIKGGSQQVTLVVGRLPKMVGIDPFNERIDRDSDDNFTPVKLESGPATPAAPRSEPVARAGS